MEKLVLEFVVRSLLVAGGTAAVLELLRVKSPRARHGAWAGVLLLMLLLPVWTAWGPRATLRILPALPAPKASAAVRLMRVQMPVISNPTPALPKQAPLFDLRSMILALYAAVALGMLTRLAVGTVRAQRLIRRSVRCEGHWVSEACAAPVTVGSFRPRVLLPGNWRTWTPAQLDAVLAHEGEHVRRLDPLFQWLALFNRGLFWFHPLTWWLERRLSALAEEACDAAVLARGCDPVDYSAYLLELARSIERAGARVRVVGMAMPGSSLPRRIRQIVTHRQAAPISPVRVAVLVAACIGVSGLFAAGTVERKSTPPTPPMPPAPPAVLTNSPPAPPPPPAAPAPLNDIPAPPPPPAAVPAKPATPPAPPVPPAAQSAAPRPPEIRFAERRPIAMYLDPGAMTPDDFARAIAMATDFVSKQMKSTDLVALIVAGQNGVTVAEDFTFDRERLVRTLQNLSTFQRSANPAGDLAYLADAVQMLGRLDGKKSLIYFSGGLDVSDSIQTQPLINAAVRNNVALYPIDARGVAAIVQTAAPGPFHLSPGDTVAVTFFQDGRFNGTYTIQPNGTITFPLLGEIKASGLTLIQFQDLLNTRLASSFDNPKFTVNLTHVRAHDK